MDPLVKAFIGGAVRWLITILAARGLPLPGDDTIRDVVSGFVAVSMLLWSWYQKRQADKRIDLARKTGV